MVGLSPMMQQYLQVKEKYKDTILFFRLGDFYEMFFEDAKTASKELELTLTSKDCGKKERAPMCGVPYHSSEGYIARLVERGYKVAICEQLESAAASKGIVKRDVIRVITPGTVLESSMLDASKNNFISSMFLANEKVGVCFCDISTGELYATEFSDDQVNQKLKNELSRFSPKEILIGGDVEKLKNLSSFIQDKLFSSVEMLDDSEFDYEISKTTILSHFKKETLRDINLENKNIIISSLGALLRYLGNTQKKGLERINAIEIYNDSNFMMLDFNTRRNLELTKTMRDGEKRGSLLWVIDKTRTAMGKRLLRLWIEQPLLSSVKINKRQNAVRELYSNIILRSSIIDSLFGISDLERLMTRIIYGSANARDLKSLEATLSKLPGLKRHLKDVKSAYLRHINESIDTMQDIKDLIENSIVDEPPFSIREGGIIKKGYNKEIDELQNDMNNSKTILANIEAEERKKTGIPKLKVSYNRIAGYYIEVTNSYKDKVPDEYIRKQTLSNSERYITKELKDLEGRILGAKDKVIELEYQLFNKIREAIAIELPRIQKAAKAIAHLDVFASLANVAATNKYVCPLVNTSGKIIIKDGRHPVVEELQKNTPFVPNDVLLDKDNNRMAIITGPNMAGKSTYMRQTAIITLMAQIGSFVPASEAEIGVVDSIFTRVGASDDLASGQSTFMVEMTEVAHIINNATQDSLIVLDEIGRGTSTFDGMSIARSAIEYISNKKKVGAKTLFATHYHELTELEELLDGVKNYNIAVKKRGDDITFLRRIVRGAADDSYGIEVAKLAGVPDEIVSRAKQILNNLESGKDEPNQNISKKHMENKNTNKSQQLELNASKGDILVDKINKIDVNTLTPIEAMNILFDLANSIKD